MQKGPERHCIRVTTDPRRTKAEEVATDGSTMGGSASGHAPGLLSIGRHLSAHAADLGREVPQRCHTLLDPYPSDARDRVWEDIVDRCTLATATVGHFLLTGERATPAEWKAIAAAGRASASARISLADMTKLYLCWRDVVLEAVRAHAHRTAIDPRSLQVAEDTVRVGCDASLVRTAKQFDIRRHELQVQLADEQARLAHLARHDALTGLPNRRTLFEELGTVVEACHRGGHAAAVLFVDLDQFKAVNDRAGHSTGDELLRGVAERLAGITRPEDMVARLGGDEFVVLCSGLRVEDAQLEAERVADRIHTALREPFVINGVRLVTSASIGLSVVRPGDDPERLLSKADAAMYVAKQARILIRL